MKSNPSQISQQAMMIARESASPKNRQSNLSAFLKDNHPDVPPVVYHGTADDITQFQHGHSNKKDAGWLGKGFYFTNNKSLANSYSMLKRGNNENVMPIHLSLKNPFQANMEHKNAIKQKLFSGDQFAPSDFTDNLIAKGHDGVILNYGDREGTKEYVVFNPTQIKSAIGNNGDYDPTHPDITKSNGGMVADPKKAARAALYVARKTFAGGGDVTDNPNFQTWFGDSALHDNGVPRTYYTGTSKDKDFTSFNVGRHGAWFTTDPQEASMYAMENDSQGHVWESGGYKRTNTASRVIPAYLKASNPYTGDRPQHISNSQNYKKAQSDWFDQLRAAGHDAWVPASMNGSLAVMLKHPTQIKSAIGNNGNFDSKSPHIAKATGGATDDVSASKHAPHHPAVAELKHLLTMHRDELRSMKGRTQYAAIDGIMKRISHEHGIAPSKLHDDWMSVYHQTPDAWVAGDHGSVVDRALKMTNRGGYAFGGSPAALAPATGAPINFAPAAGAFTGLPLPKGPDIAPSKATLAAILASRPTTYTGSSKPLESKYIGPSIAAPTFNASAYNLPDNPLEEGQGGSGDRWHPNGGGAPTGGTAEMAAAAAAAAGPLGGGYGDSDAAARGGRIHRANDDRVQHALSLTRHAALPGRQHTRGRP